MLKSILTLLIIIAIIAIYQLNNIKHNAIGLVFRDELFPIAKYPELIETRINEPYFKANNVIEVYSRSNCNLKALNSFDISKIGTVDLNYQISNDRHSRNIHFKVKVNDIEKEKVEVVIEKPIYIETLRTSENEVSGISDLEIKVNTAFDEFLDIISRDIKADVNVMIDYTEVNLSKIGNYPLSYHFDDKTITVNVLIY